MPAAPASAGAFGAGKEPRFIRTVLRQGYRFVYAEVIEAPDELKVENVEFDGHKSRTLLILVMGALPVI